MNDEEAVRRCRGVLAHLWMIRTFLKHADEAQDHAELLEVPRLLYDTIRAVEPADQRGDTLDYLRRLKGKLGKLRTSAAYLTAAYKDISAHTNFEMASVSFSASVEALERIFAEWVPPGKA